MHQFYKIPYYITSYLNCIFLVVKQIFILRKRTTNFRRFKAFLFQDFYGCLICLRKATTHNQFSLAVYLLRKLIKPLLSREHSASIVYSDWVCMDKHCQKQIFQPTAVKKFRAH